MSFIIRGLSSLLGTVLPCFYSYKAMKKPTNPKLTHWLQYWTVYGAYSALDWIASTFFISCFIPFYDLFALMFIVYISVPQIGGSAFVYKKILAPFFRRKERQVDSILGKCFKAIWAHAPSMISNGVSSVVAMLGESATSNAITNNYQLVSTVRSTNAAPDSRVLRNAISYFATAPALDDSIELQDDSDDEVEYVPRHRNRRFQYESDEADEIFPKVVEVKKEPVDDYESGDSDVQIVEPVVVTRRIRTRQQSAASVIVEDTVEAITTAQAPTPAGTSRPARGTRTGAFARRGGRGGGRKAPATREIKTENA